MSVFTHGVTTKGKPWLINRNQVFTVALRRKLLSTQWPEAGSPPCPETPMGTDACSEGNCPGGTIPQVCSLLSY